MKKLLLLAVVGVVLGTAGYGVFLFARPPTTLDELLQHVPDDAAMVTVFPDLAALDGGALSLGRAVGRDFGPAPSESLLDLVPVRDETIAHALAGRGALVLAWHPDRAAPLAIIGVSGRHRPHGPDRATVRVDGHVLLASRDPAWFAGKHPAGMRTGRHWANAFPAAYREHVLVHIDVPRWKNAINNKLFFVGSAATMAAASQGDQVIDAINFATEQAMTLADETEVVTLAGRIDDSGLRMHCTMRPRAGGVIADYLGAIRHLALPWDRIAGAPPGRLVAVFGGAWRLDEQRTCLTEALIRQFLTKLAGDDQGDRAAVIEAATAYRGIDGQLSTMMTDDDGHFQYVTFMSAREPQAIFEDMVKLSVAIQRITGGAMHTEPTLTRETIANQPAAVMTVVFPAANPMQRRTMQAMYGGEELATVFLPLANGIWTCMGTPTKARELAKNVARGEQPLLRDDPRVKPALASISPNPDIFGLIDISQVIRVGWEVTSAITPNAPSPPPHPQPAGSGPSFLVMGAYLRPAAIEFEIVIPAGSIDHAFRELDAARHLR